MMTEKKEKNMEEYITALEDELLASIEREEQLTNEEMKIRVFLGKKIRGTKLYKDIVADPNSKMGKVVRAPRSAYRLIKNPEVRKSLIQKKTEKNGKYGQAGTFLEPWKVSGEIRKKIAEGALGEGRRLALYFVEKPDSSTFRYRCYNTFEATRKSRKWQAVYFFKDELAIVEQILPKSSIVIFGRQSGQEKLVNKLVNLAHEHKIKVGLDIDDLVFDLDRLDLFLDTIGEKTNKSYWMSYFASVQAMAKKMDYFITTNSFLAGELEKTFDKQCGIIKNSINDPQVDASLVYLRQKKAKKDVFEIGYFSGSPTHAKDFAVAEPAIIKFLKKHDDAILKVVGFMRFSKEAEQLVEKGKIKFLPMVDFRKLQKLMSDVDVNIAPLLVNDFTNCKSELKFFEAALVETVTIASPTYTFEKSITDGENGFLAEPGEWYDKLEYLYKNPSERIKVAKNARKYALDNYYGEKFLREVENTYEELV